MLINNNILSMWTTFPNTLFAKVPELNFKLLWWICVYVYCMFASKLEHSWFDSSLFLWGEISLLTSFKHLPLDFSVAECFLSVTVIVFAIFYGPYHIMPFFNVKSQFYSVLDLTLMDILWKCLFKKKKSLYGNGTDWNCLNIWN